MSSQSIWVKLDRYPPVIVRVLAKASALKPLSDDQIVARSGGQLSLADVKQLSYSPTWDDVPVAKMRSFVRACGVDFADAGVMRRLNRLLREQTKFRHLTLDPRFPEFQAMLKEYFRHESSRS